MTEKKKKLYYPFEMRPEKSIDSQQGQNPSEPSEQMEHGYPEAAGRLFGWNIAEQVGTKTRGDGTNGPVLEQTEHFWNRIL